MTQNCLNEPQEIGIGGDTLLKVRLPYETSTNGDELSGLSIGGLESLLAHFTDTTPSIALAACPAFASEPKEQGKPSRHVREFHSFTAK
ncbi:hypothetical protein [Brucella oryzae]|uniref:hypothetical protein n=1 Tax=Brucella oryzae TaxID=335286 RepID=UPI001FE0AF41|nr:hypothetical protein [Brucella oryzae]